MKVTSHVPPPTGTLYTIHDLTLLEISLIKSLLGNCGDEKTKSVDVSNLYRTIKEAVGDKGREFDLYTKHAGIAPVIVPTLVSL